MKKFTFLIPVFNDWDSLGILLERIDQEISPFEDIFDVVVLNDGSAIKHSIKNKNFKKLNLIKILNLKRNLGSQRALAIGLKYLSDAGKETNIILMDADGEDDPNLLKKIIDYLYAKIFTKYHMKKTFSEIYDKKIITKLSVID